MIKFNDKQKKFMKDIGIKADFDNPSDDDLVLIEEKVADKLETKGFDSDYKITDVGQMCESILDKLND